MTDTGIVERIESAIDQVAGSYEQLVLLVGPPGSGKTEALREVSNRRGAPQLNVNLELSRRLLDEPEARRPFRVRSHFEDILDETNSPLVALDNIEILFDPGFELNPLQLLRACARERTLVVAWGGRIDGRWLTYAEPGHPEHRREAIGQTVVITVP